MTLVEFLHARLAEDEQRAEQWPDDEAQVGLYDTAGHVVYQPRRRLLAEAEAKRRIVELAEEATGLDMQVDNEFRVGIRDSEAEPYVGDLILRALALPHADHPDYDPAWRV